MNPNKYHLTYDEYVDMAIRSMKEHDSKELALCDWAFGLGGEVAEAMMTKEWHSIETAKELGDILWYYTAFINELGVLPQPNYFESESISPADITSQMIALGVKVFQIQERLKHYLFHKDEDIGPTITAAIEFIHLWVSVCRSLEFNPSYVAALNAYKLNHRYGPDGSGRYNVQNSQNRKQTERVFEATEEYKDLHKLLMG